MTDAGDDQLEIARRVEMVVFPSAGFTADAIVHHIRHEALACGVPEVQISHDLGEDWIVMHSNSDWLPRGEEGLSTFFQMLPVEGQVNLCRGEVFLTAFADVVVTVDRFGLHVIVDKLGRAEEAERLPAVESEGRIVAFIIGDHSRR